MDQARKFELLPYVLIFTRKWRVLVVHFVFICTVAIVYAFVFAKKEYKSSITFLPPPNESSIGSLVRGISLPDMSSNDILPEQIGTIFGSSTLRRQVIEKFDLYNHYNLMKSPAKFKFALKLLEKDLSLSVKEKDGLGSAKTICYSIDSYHTSADTALALVNYSYNLLDSVVRAISVSRARRTRVFMGEQLVANKLKLDSLQDAMKRFQQEKKAYDVPEQIKMTVAAYSQVKATMLANEIQIQSLKSNFSNETPAIFSLQKTNDVYLQKLKQLENAETIDVVPSLAASTTLMPQFVNLMRENETQTQLLLLLTSEFEQAKIKEAKNISSLVVTDAAYKAEYKSRPKRIMIVGLFVIAYFGIVFLLYIYREFYISIISKTDFYKAIKASL